MVLPPKKGFIETGITLMVLCRGSLFLGPLPPFGRSELHQHQSSTSISILHTAELHAIFSLMIMLYYSYYISAWRPWDRPGLYCIHCWIYTMTYNHGSKEVPGALYAVSWKGIWSNKKGKVMITYSQPKHSEIIANSMMGRWFSFNGASLQRATLM